MTVAALFVEDGGVYFGLEGVDPWPESRDARKYAGPHPVVAHPPCQRWGKFWWGSPGTEVRFRMGDDGGAFASALWAVRTFGGVLEHPEASKAWRWFGLAKPDYSGGWTRADFAGGWTCHVEQGHYGFSARKPTWLYVNGDEPPSLKWGPSDPPSRVGRQGIRGGKRGTLTQSSIAWMTKRERCATPPAFRDLLLSIARSAS